MAVAYMKSLPATNRDLFSESYRGLPSFKAMMRRYVERIAFGTADSSAGLPEIKTLGLASDKLRAQILRLVGKENTPDLFDFIVDQSAIRHVFDRHTNAKIDLSRGQRP